MGRTGDGFPGPELVGEPLSEERGALSKAKLVGAGNGNGRIRPGSAVGAVGADGAVGAIGATGAAVGGDGERLVVGGGLRERSSREARRRQYMKPRLVRLSMFGDVDANPGLSSRTGDAMTLTRSGGGGFDDGEDSAPTMESMLKASLGLLLLEEQLTPEAVDAVGADADVELTDTTKGFVGAIGSMLNVCRPHVTIWPDYRKGFVTDN